MPRMRPRWRKASKNKSKAKEGRKGIKETETETETVSPEDTKEKELPDECSICFLEHTDTGGQRPYILPCVHRFCIQCVSNMIVKGLITCPTCRAKHKFSPEIEWTVAELNRLMERKERSSRFGSRLHFAREKIEGDLEESERKLEKLNELNDVIAAEIQKQKFDAFKENQYLCVLVVEERNFIIGVQKNMDCIRDRLMDVLTGLKCAECDGEVHILTIEAEMYKNGLKRNEALIKERQARLMEICERANYLEGQGKELTKFEGQKKDDN